MTLEEADVERILAAAETIEESLGILVEYQSMERSAYHEDRVARDVVERRFVKTTEATLDIAETLVRKECNDIPASNPEGMGILVSEGVLSPKTGDQMRIAARFRNVLAHTYGDIIDHNTVYDALQDLRRYREFLAEVRDFMVEIGALECE